MSFLWWFQKGGILGYKLLHSYMKIASGDNYFNKFSSSAQCHNTAYPTALNMQLPSIFLPSQTLIFPFGPVTQLPSKSLSSIQQTQLPAASPTALNPFGLPRQFFLNYSFRAAAFQTNFSIPLQLLSRKRRFQPQRPLQQHYWLQLTAQTFCSSLATLRSSKGQEPGGRTLPYRSLSK